MVTQGRRSEASITQTTSKITRELDEREMKWNKQQEKLKEQQMAELLKAKVKQDAKLTQKITEANDWGGPFEQSEQLADFLSKKNVKEKQKLKILKTEVTIRRDIAKFKGVSSKLFAVNRLSAEVLASNLDKLISGQY